MRGLGKKVGGRGRFCSNSSMGRAEELNVVARGLDRRPGAARPPRFDQMVVSVLPKKSR